MGGKLLRLQTVKKHDMSGELLRLQTVKKHDIGSKLLTESGIKAMNQNDTEINSEKDVLLQQEDLGQTVQYIFDADGSRGIRIVKILIYMMSAVFVFLLLVGIGVFVCSEFYRYAAVACMIQSIVSLTLAVLLTIADIYWRKFTARYKKYYEVLKSENNMLIEDMSEYWGIAEDTIVSDLNKAVKLKLIPQGHFSEDDKVFMVSDKC